MDLQPSHGRRLAPTPAAVLLATLAATLLALVTTSAPARADVGETIIDRCTHGESLSGFSQHAYEQALKDISAGTEEYSNCAAQIREAQLAAAGGRAGVGPGTPTSTGAVALTPTPAEREAIARAPRVGAAPVRVGGQAIKPGVVQADVASAFSTLPTPLLATVLFLVVCLLVVAGSAIRGRLRSRRSQ
jgi:hypothetical protein